MSYRIHFAFAVVALALVVLACGPLTAITSRTSGTSDSGAPPGQDAEAAQSAPAESAAESAAQPDAQRGDPAPAPIVNDEGGPALVTGEVPYTNVFFTEGVAQPMVILEDQAGFVDRDKGYVIPVASQTIGQITSDFFTSPFTYSLALPIEPAGTLRDVDFDGEEEPGVMVFAVAYWNNVWGDPFLEERDLGGGGWSTAYASTRTSEEAETEAEIIGGRLIVYAPDDQQSFPSGFGADGLLFTEDDPLVLLPEGYTLVDLDADPFTFDRSEEVTVDLIEPEGTALDDFSDLGYADAFDAMLAKMRTEYAFTEYKNIDWDTLAETYRPRFVEAERQGPDAYRVALRDFLAEIPDGHVSGPFVLADFQQSVGGGLGLAVRELDDGRVVVVAVIPGSPGAEAGIELGTEIISVNGRNITSVVDETRPWLGPFSTDHNRRLDRLRFALRYPVGTEVALTYANPGAEAETVDLTAVQEVDSLLAVWPGSELTGFELPVEYEVLASGVVYTSINSFFDTDVLTILLWERLMETLNQNEVPGLIIDLRQNGGGRGFLADQMAAYLFDEPLVLGNSGRYDESLGDFYFDPDTEEEFILPPENLRYDGPVVAIVSPDCASACEFFAYDLTLEDRALIVGHYPTAGLGGGVDEFKMPEEEFVRFTVSRSVDADGNIHIEGRGVSPDIVVPVTGETLFSTGDPLLERALVALQTGQ